MRRKSMLAVLLSVGMALSQSDRRPIPDPSLEREKPLRQLKAINDAATTYYSWLKRVPTSLQQLGGRSDGKIANADAADLITSDLASGVTGGYSFTLIGSTAGWTVRAVPLIDDDLGFHTTYTVETRITRPNAKRSSETQKQ